MIIGTIRASGDICQACFPRLKLLTLRATVHTSPNDRDRQFFTHMTRIRTNLAARFTPSPGIKLAARFVVFGFAICSLSHRRVIAITSPASIAAGRYWRTATDGGP